MKFGSVCSGIEAASVAFGPLGWEASWFSEIEPFPSAVLAHHYPHVPNLGDMTKIADGVLAGAYEAPDMLCGGTPCQAFSVAGLRQSLADERGNLSLVFCELADAIDHTRNQRGEEPCVVFWENVPGVLSTSDNAFGCFLAGLAGESEPLVAPGGKWSNAGAVLGPKRTVAWRTLDAQYFGLAQRRRRVFVVASAREGFDPAAVLFEFDGVRRDSAPSREAGEDSANRAALSVALRGREGGATAELGDDVAGCLRASSGGGDKPHALVPARVQTHRDGRNAGGMGRIDAESETLIPQTFACGGIGNYSSSSSSPPMASGADLGPGCETLVTRSLRGEGFDASINDGLTCSQQGAVAHVSIMPTMTAGGPSDTSHNQVSGQMRDAYMVPTVAMQVRRLIPEECEALQGFSRSYTAIPWRKKPASECPDGPRYKALGNSWAVPCVQWIGRRLTAQMLGEPVTAKPALVMHESVRALFQVFLRRIRRAESTNA